MTLEQAKRVKITFGRYSEASQRFSGHGGMTLGDIAIQDILYLDWLAAQDNLTGELAEAIPIVYKYYRPLIDKALERP